MKKQENDNFSITGTIITEIIKEQDEHTIAVIERYIKRKQLEGEIISSQLIGEGKIRHIFNLGLMEYSRLNHIPVTQENLFTQEDYIQYLNHRLNLAEKKVRQLEDENQRLAEMSGLLSTNTMLGGEDDE